MIVVAPRAVLIFLAGLLVVAYIGVVLFYVAWVAWRRRSLRRGETYCGRCRYNLKGAASWQCPECGNSLKNGPLLTRRVKPLFPAELKLALLLILTVPAALLLCRIATAVAGLIPWNSVQSVAVNVSADWGAGDVYWSFHPDASRPARVYLAPSHTRSRALQFDLTSDESDDAVTAAQALEQAPEVVPPAKAEAVAGDLTLLMQALRDDPETVEGVTLTELQVDSVTIRFGPSPLIPWSVGVTLVFTLLLCRLCIDLLYRRHRRLTVTHEARVDAVRKELGKQIERSRAPMLSQA